jgi:tRNA threonylcarbamoyladenosine biosynthesis protein TsaE
MIYTISEIHNAVEVIKSHLDTNKVVLFNGSMGAGKTTLISALCKSLGSTDELSSPTFSIVNEYSSKMGTIYHFDFYRIKSIEEAFDFGLEEYLFSGNYCFLEWAEKVEVLLPETLMIVDISIIDENTRELNISFS